MPESQSEWTISTLKEHFEQLLGALKDKCKADTDLLTAKFENAADALVKQAAEYERRLKDLNNEAGRITAAGATSVSREVYESDKKTDNEWKRRVESLVNNAVAKSEFQTYKDSTSTALTLQAGKREGAGGIGQTVFMGLLGLSSLVGIILGVVALLAPRNTAQSSPPAPIIYVTPQTAPGDPTTVKVKP